MPYTMKDFRREIALEYLDQLTLEERLRGITPEEMLRGLSKDQIKALKIRMLKGPLEPKPKKSKRRTR